MPSHASRISSADSGASAEEWKTGAEDPEDMEDTTVSSDENGGDSPGDAAHEPGRCQLNMMGPVCPSASAAPSAFPTMEEPDAMPDAMLVDIEMPNMDGFDLTRNIRSDAKTRHMPLVMITSRTADKHRRYAEEIGVDVYLGKPYSEDFLLDTLRGLIGERAEGVAASVVEMLGR